MKEESQYNKNQNEELPNIYADQRKTVKPFCHILPIILNISLGQFYFGYGVAYFSSIDIQTLISYYAISMDQNVATGIFNGCISIGACIGSVLSSKFIIGFSRRNSVLATNCIALTAGILIFVPNQIFLIFMRLAQGLCIGVYSATIPLYIKQLSPIQYSGSFGAFNQFFIVLGVFFSFSFAFVLESICDDPNGQDIWFYIFGFPLSILVFQSILLFTIYSFQTPKYLILQHKSQEQVTKLLSIFYQKEHLKQIYNKLLQVQQIKESHQEKSQQKQFEDIQQKNTTILLQKKQKQRKSPNIAIFLALYMSLSQQMVGLNAVVIYGGQITKQVLPSLKGIVPIIINFLPVLSALVVSYLLSKYGRKQILMIGVLSVSIINLIIGVGFLLNDAFQELSVALILFGLFSYITVYGASVGPILWIYMPQIVSSYILPYSTLMNWLGAAIVLTLFPIIRGTLPGQNPGGLFLWFSLYSFICLIVYSKLVIQTRGKNQKQIYQQYKYKKIKFF